MKKRKFIRVGIVLAELGSLNVNALKYLVLQMNTHLHSIQFEFIPDISDQFLEYGPNCTLDWRIEEQRLPNHVKKLKTSVRALQEAYQLDKEMPDYFVIISLCTFSDRYYFRGDGESVIFALGDWDQHMSPPSILEFIVTLLITVGLMRSSTHYNLRKSHLGTKGCIADFTSSLSDARFKALTGFICQQCAAHLEKDGFGHLLSETRPILDRSWLGEKSDVRSPAAITSKLGFDLFTTKGISPSRRERLVNMLEQQGVEQLVKIAAILVITLLTFVLGLLGIKLSGLG